MRSLRGAAAPISRLRRVRAQEDETILHIGFPEPSSGAVRPPGSAGTDQAPGDGERGQRLDKAGLRTAPFSLSWAKRARRPAMSPLRTECFDIFSPPPGASDVTT